MGDISASYIRMVQHLIEKCLLFHMSKEECMEALSKHANIKPVITSTVWKELEKENKDFFEEYGRRRGGGGGEGISSSMMSEEETNQKIHQILTSDSSSSSAARDSDS